MQYCMTHLLQAARASTKKGISPATAHRTANKWGRRHEAGIFLASSSIIAAELGFPVYQVLMNAAVPVIPGFILIVFTSVVFLKLVSYVHCNWDLRYFTCCQLPDGSMHKMGVCVLCLIAACMTWVCAFLDMYLIDACTKWVCASHDICLIDACTQWVGAS